MKPHWKQLPSDDGWVYEREDKMAIQLSSVFGGKRLELGALALADSGRVAITRKEATALFLALLRPREKAHLDTGSLEPLGEWRVEMKILFPEGTCKYSLRAKDTPDQLMKLVDLHVPLRPNPVTARREETDTINKRLELLERKITQLVEWAGLNDVEQVPTED